MNERDKLISDYNLIVDFRNRLKKSSLHINMLLKNIHILDQAQAPTIQDIKNILNEIEIFGVIYYRLKIDDFFMWSMMGSTIIGFMKHPQVSKIVKKARGNDVDVWVHAVALRNDLSIYKGPKTAFD